MDRMHWVVQMANRWTGPISMSLFVPDVEFSIAKYFIEHLRNCYSNVRDRVTFHSKYRRAWQTVMTSEYHCSDLPRRTPS